MGFFGRVTGWDRQKDAHNAVLASHLAETASQELRREIVKRLVIIQQQVRGGSAGDPHRIVAELSEQPRIVQMNFIAMACNSMGLPSGLPGLFFAEVTNPYRANNDSSRARIGVALDDLMRRSGSSLQWPGDHERIDFLTWGGFQASREASQPSTSSANVALNPEYAAHLAFRNLLAELIDFEMVLRVARDLEEVGNNAGSDKELALATALFFFEHSELTEVLEPAQMQARLAMLQWLQNGEVRPGPAAYFEDQLYELYKP